MKTIQVRDYVNLEKPCAVKLAAKRFYRRNKDNLIFAGMVIILTLASSVDLFGGAL